MRQGGAMVGVLDEGQENRGSNPCPAIWLTDGARWSSRNRGSSDLFVLIMLVEGLNCRSEMEPPELLVGFWWTSRHCSIKRELKVERILLFLANVLSSNWKAIWRKVRALVAGVRNMEESSEANYVHGHYILLNYFNWHVTLLHEPELCSVQPFWSKSN